ncbi:multicopy suppressor of a budding defect [Lodderomyces elongisporus]|uniref:multicopy suppressor of a budding defect n=1 Tax=Lodderomyces elongisporus TaxID=36914 RepID=UPI00291C6388|nr:multicopy suppressor of a budding defect [Lodderomyces elongisporus]WLF77587.1 multicopy suppressor of a budding defect [Lodderomyces elongisporus]
MMDKPLPNVDKLQLPKLPEQIPGLAKDQSHDYYSRKDLKTALHIITQELKKRGTKTPHIFLPFRSRVDDRKLNHFLTKLAPKGVVSRDATMVSELCKETNEFTLICSLKYFWSRLPNNEIIGMDVYKEFKRKEEKQGYPKNAFLTIMPKCLSSPAHASIVYDFLDLLLSVIANSQYNYLSGRKVSRMASFWAFNSNLNVRNKSVFADFDNEQEHDFPEGLDNWKVTTMALFHLVLSFLRSMLPENDSETLKLPKALQNLLVTTQYPPEEKENSRKVVAVPCICVSTTRPSLSAYDLISKVRQSLPLDKKDEFSKENYTILKNVFLKKSTSEVVDTFTQESTRVLDRISDDGVENEFGLRPGWAKPTMSQASSSDKGLPLFSHIVVKDVMIQDYYIWTWLSSLASDQPEVQKRTFGRSIVVEADVLGFKKWIVITEKSMDKTTYTKLSGQRKKQQYKQNKMIIHEEYKDTPLPPLPKEISTEAPVVPNKETLPTGEISPQSKTSPVGPTGLPQDIIDVYEEFERSYGEESSYIYPTPVSTETPLPQSPEPSMSSSDSRFTKTTTGPIFAPQKTNPTRKAPPKIDDGIQHISSDGSTKPQVGLPTLKTQELLDKEKQEKLEAKRAKRRAEKAQLAAAKAAGFQFPMFSSDVQQPPPPPPPQPLPFDFNLTLSGEETTTAFTVPPSAPTQPIKSMLIDSLPDLPQQKSSNRVHAKRESKDKALPPIQLESENVATHVTDFAEESHQLSTQPVPTLQPPRPNNPNITTGFVSSPYGSPIPSHEPEHEREQEHSQIFDNQQFSTFVDSSGRYSASPAITQNETGKYNENQGGRFVPSPVDIPPDSHKGDARQEARLKIPEVEQTANTNGSTYARNSDEVAMSHYPESDEHVKQQQQQQQQQQQHAASRSPQIIPAYERHSSKSPQMGMTNPRSKSTSPVHPSMQHHMQGSIPMQHVQHMTPQPMHSAQMQPTQPMQPMQPMQTQPMQPMQTQPLQPMQPMQPMPQGVYQPQMYPYYQQPMYQQPVYQPQMVPPQPYPGKVPYQQPMYNTQSQMPSHPPHPTHAPHAPPMQPRTGAAMNMVPVGVKHNKNKTANKANLRQAFVKGDYGI